MTFATSWSQDGANAVPNHSLRSRLAGQGLCQGGDQLECNSAMPKSFRGGMRTTTVFPHTNTVEISALKTSVDKFACHRWKKGQVLMGFPRGYTAHCLPKGQRQGGAWRDERLSLLGNSWCVFVIVWLLHCLRVPRGLCNRLSLSELMQQCKPGGGSRLQSFLLRPFMRVPREAYEAQPDLLARTLTGLQGRGPFVASAFRRCSAISPSACKYTFKPLALEDSLWLAVVGKC